MSTSRNTVNVGSPLHIEAIGPNGRQQPTENRNEQIALIAGGLGAVNLMAVAMGVRRPPAQQAPMANYLANKKMRAKSRKR